MTGRRPVLAVLDDRPRDRLADVVVRVRRRPDGGRFVRLAADLVLEDADVVRALAERLLAAARSLDEPGS